MWLDRVAGVGRAPSLKPKVFKNVNIALRTAPGAVSTKKSEVEILVLAPRSLREFAAAGTP
jgi:hypothetical protein